MIQLLVRCIKNTPLVLAFFVLPCLAQSPAVDWSCYLPEDSSLQIKVQVFSGRPDPVFNITDSAALHAIKSRLRFYLDSSTAPGGVIGCPSMLGYRGIAIEPSCYPSFTLCNGRILAARSGLDSRLFMYPDSGNEFERMIIQAGVREKCSYSDSYGTIRLADIVPDSLKIPIQKFGILTWEILSDSTRIDFSVLDTPFSSMMQIRQQQTFPDAKLTWLVYSSISPALFRVEAPYSSNQPFTVDWKSALLGGALSSAKALDSLRLDFLKRVDALDTGCGSTFGCGDSGGGILIQTSEGGLAYFKPAGQYIGGIDRIYLFFAYSSDGAFASSTTVTSTHCYKQDFQLSSAGQMGLFDLKGRRIIEMQGRNSSSNGIGSRRNIILHPGSGAYIQRSIAR